MIEGYDTREDVFEKNIDVDLRILTIRQRARFDEIISVSEFIGHDMSDNVRGAIFECVRGKMSTSEALDIAFRCHNVDRACEESGVDFNTVGVRDRVLLEALTDDVALIHAALAYRDFDFVDFKPVDLQGFHRYLCVDVFGGAGKTTKSVARTMADVFTLMPEEKTLRRMQGPALADRLAPFIGALFSVKTFLYCDEIAKRLFVFELSRMYGWDLRLRDVPVPSLKSTLALSGERPQMLARLLRGMISDVDETEIMDASSRFIDTGDKPGPFKVLRQWMGVE